MKKIRITAVISAVLSVLFLLSACGKIDLSGIVSMLDTLEDVLSDSEDGSNAENTGVPDVVEKDENGRIVKLSHFDGDGNLVFVHTTTWDNDRIKNKSSFDKSGNQTASIDYEYDERGNNTVTSWFFWNSGTLMRSESIFDEYDRAVEITNFGTKTVSTNKTYIEYDDKDGEHPKKYKKKTYYPSYPGERYNVTTYEYNADGTLDKNVTVDKDGNPVSTDIYTYKDGLLAEYTSYDAENKPRYTYKYIYDENGKKIREERYNGEGVLEGIDY
jgi:hypothetical protein